jgi:hypothetical protein
MGLLGTHQKGRTVLVIAHRLSTVRTADKVVVIDGGSIAEVSCLVPAQRLFCRFLYRAPPLISICVCVISPESILVWECVCSLGWVGRGLQIWVCGCGCECVCTPVSWVCESCMCMCMSVRVCVHVCVHVCLSARARVRAGDGIWVKIATPFGDTCYHVKLLCIATTTSPGWNA